MIKNDILTEKLKELSRVLTTILDYTNKDEIIKSWDTLNKAYRKLMGINSSMAINLSYSDLMKFIGAYESPETVNLVVTGKLLKVHAYLCSIQGDEVSALSQSVKSAEILINALLSDFETAIDLCLDDIDEIINVISEYEIPLDCKYLIFKYYEAITRFDKAEDYLFEMREQNKESDFIKEEGEKFYEKLLTLPETVLEKGNLPIDEVKDSLESFRKI
ncbi:DUF6483 family protein [Clostridium oryzae]|uniref:Tetratricopeptide repeat protein n=1 Tax=Clostridium oryzae TaxID=1450648 RepID=A0A1V4ISH1_9CLOT|nr:DUF6483 family protein [Clostridium oryzae]OPJ62407.1 hypothetical protein CLORY_17760 [Clostridium oryzae]